MAANGRLLTDARLIDDLVEDVLNGSIRIPSFQRGLKWHQSDVIRLFDSISRGYPIGNLLLWRRRGPADKGMKIGALTIDAHETESALYVVDGQQRLTSLANALTDQGHADPRFALAYDVERQRFVEAGSESPYAIPLPVIFDISRLLSWFALHPEMATDIQYVNRANQLAKALRDFRVPVYVVEQPDEAVLRDIFDRMNTYGRTLTRAEVFTALNDSTEQNSVVKGGPADLALVASEVHAATGFGLLDENTVLLSMLARRGSNISRDIRGEFESGRSEEFPEESPLDARNSLVEAMVCAIHFLQTEASLPHFAFLPYRYLIVVLTRYFSHFATPAAGSLRNLRRWFWRAAVLGPQVTKGNITSVTRALCNRITPGDEVGSVRSLLEFLNGNGPIGTVDVSTFRTNTAVTRIMLCAMWDLRPNALSIVPQDSPVEFTLEDLLQDLGEGSSALDSIYTLTELEDIPTALRASAANRLLLPTVDGPGVDSPMDALASLASYALSGDEAALTILKSHACEVSAATALVHGDLAGFLEQRRAELDRQLASFLSRQTERQYEDTPSLEFLVIEDPEDVRDDSIDS